MRNRAYAFLNVKAFDDDARKFSGVATTPSVDRVGDIIEPMGVKYTNPMPLLHQHKHDAPVGHVRFKKPTADGVEFEAEIVKVDEPGPLKDRVDTAWGEIRHGLVRATSIGFRPIEYSFMDNGGIRYSEVEVYELSTVTIPANADAVITAVKHYDEEARAEAGIVDEVVLRVDPGRGISRINLIPIPATPEPAASGKKVRVVKLDDSRPRPAFVVRRIIRT